MNIFLVRLLTLCILATFVTCDPHAVPHKKVYNRKTKLVENAAGTPRGECPNDQYTGSGMVTSPNFPSNYGNGDSCAYFLTAPLGYVIQVQFITFTTEACCDFLYIYDGPSPIISPLLVRLAGSNLAKTVYSSSTRWMSMQFTSDQTNNMQGFQANFSSIDTAIPCNRDVVIAMDAHSTLGTEANYRKQIDFVSNTLVANWTVGPTGIQVGPTLYAQDEATEYFLNDAKSVADLQTIINGFRKQSINGQTLDSMEVAFELVTSGVDVPTNGAEAGWRLGVQRVLVMFLSFPPNNDADLQAAKVYTDKIISQGTTIVLVGLNSNVNVTQMIPLSSGPNFVFGVSDVSQLNAAFATSISSALCQIATQSN
uniref:CUB domain-containing protein n=1 Tax=Plectus sambesii TaxID=2011161 RepID=A0A914USJ4_9BILA